MRCGRSGPDTSTRSISIENAFQAMETPNAAFALSTSGGKSLKLTIVLEAREVLLNLTQTSSG